MEGFTMNSNIIVLFPPIILISDSTLYPVSRVQSINDERKTLTSITLVSADDLDGSCCAAIKSKRHELVECKNRGLLHSSYYNVQRQCYQT